MNLHVDRQGTVALMSGLMAPALLMSLALGAEVSSWSVRKLELQRTADIAAWAGAQRYAATASAAAATGAAADVAELNGMSGAATRSWTAATSTLTDNNISVQMVAGIRNGSDDAVKVTLALPVTRYLSALFALSGSTVSIRVSAIAEIGSRGTQACILALGGDSTAITTGTDVTVTGNAKLTASGCALRSDAGISQSGSSTINVAAVYAGGTITGSNICCNVTANAGQVGDPYASNNPLQTALKSLTPGQGTAVSVKSNATQSLNPGTYSSWNVNGTLNLAPGTYYVNGGISTGAQAAINGAGVTIITSGAVSTTGGSSLNLSAPLSTATTGIPGIVLANASSGTMSFLGNSTSPVSGLIYMPNASLKFGGSSNAGQSGCTQIVAGTVTLVGTSTIAANCSNYGLQPIPSLPAPPVTLVE